MRSPKRKQEEEDDVMPSFEVHIPLFEKSPPEITRDVARATAPDVSIPFLLLFSAAAYFHESQPWAVGILALAWLSLQTFMYVTEEDFRSDLFWNAFSLVGYLIFYLILGLVWSFAKLYLDVWQGHMPAAQMKVIVACFEDTGREGCVMDILLSMKWDLMRSMLAAPISFAYTLSRDPLRLLSNVIFDTFMSTYASILQQAVAAYKVRISGEIVSNKAASWSALGYSAGVFFVYLVIGYAWTHIKLFVDVLYATLPRSLDEEVRGVWNGDKNYWNFIKKIKYLVVSWVLFWPISILYTLLRHPIKILVDFIYRLSQRKYIWIVNKAMESRMKQD